MKLSKKSFKRKKRIIINIRDFNHIIKRDNYFIFL